MPIARPWGGLALVRGVGEGNPGQLAVRGAPPRLRRLLRASVVGLAPEGKAGRGGVSDSDL